MMTTETNLQSPEKSFHFIGIAGSGMAPLAHLASLRGFKITGSDNAPSDSSSLRSLKKAGISIQSGHAQTSLIENAESVVRSSAIQESNPELIFGIEKKKNILHRSDFLNILTQNKKTIAVTGTHGKTTTTSMISFLLKTLHSQVDSVVGGVMKDFNSAFLYHPKSNFFVLEADESDGTFLKYKPYAGIITNIEEDHLDFYDDLNHIESCFLDFLKNVSADGFVVVNIDHISRNFKQYLSTKNAVKISCSDSTDADFCFNFADGGVYLNGCYFSFKPKIIGDHNLSNFAAAATLGIKLGFDPPSVFATLEQFTGVKRRLDKIFENSVVTLYDDYAHNPGKIAACLSAIRKAHESTRIVVLFQPHRYSRVLTLYDNFCASFSSSDQVYLTNIYASGEKFVSIDLNQMADDISVKSKTRCNHIDNAQKIADHVLDDIMTPTVVVSVGAGDICQVLYDLKTKFLEPVFEKSEAPTNL